MPQIMWVEESNRGRLLQSLKSVLTTDFPGTEIFGKPYTLEDLLVLLLGEIKKRADKIVGEDVKNVVLGRPVKYVGKDNEKLALARMAEVAKKVGFERIEFELEPIGAALSWGQRQKSDERVLVFDFGGGTLDVSVAQFPEGKILGVAGAPIGGDLIDSQMMQDKILKYFGKEASWGEKRLEMPRHILQALENWYTISLLKTKQFLDSLEYLKTRVDDKAAMRALEDLIVYNLGFGLFEVVNRSKKGLSDSLTEKISFHQKAIQIEENISRLEFETMISDLLTGISECVAEGLKLSGLEEENVDRVVMTGGSSLIPIVRSRLEQKFGPDKVTNMDAFTSVVQGLGIKAGRIFGS